MTVLISGVLAAIVAAGFGLLVNVPPRALLATAFLGAMGRIIRELYLASGGGIVFGSLVAALCIGFGGMILTVHQFRPPTVITLAAVVPLVPGTYFYDSIVSLLTLISDGGADEQAFVAMGRSMLIAFLIAISLAAGIIMPRFLLRGRSVREIIEALKGRK